MKLNWTDVLNVIVALAIFKVIDKLFLDDALSGLTGDGASAYERRVG